MKFIVEKDEFQAALASAARVASKKSVAQYLEGFYIKAGSKLEIITTNIDISQITVVEANILEQGALVFPKNLLEIVPKLSGSIEISVKDCIAEIKSGKFKMKLNGMPAENFPSVSLVNSDMKFSISLETLKNMISKTAFATATEEGKDILKGVYFDIDNTDFHMVATDSFRLAYTKTEIENSHKISAIVPRKVCEEIKKLTGDDAEISINDKSISITTADTTLICSLITGQYIVYKRFIENTSTETKIKANKQEFLNAVNRVGIIDTDTNRFKLAINKDFLLFSAQSERGMAEDEISADITGNVDFTVIFSSKFLKEGIEKIEKEFEFNLGNAVSASNITEDNFIYIVMPVRE